MLQPNECAVTALLWMAYSNSQRCNDPCRAWQALTGVEYRPGLFQRNLAESQRVRCPAYIRCEFCGTMWRNSELQAPRLYPRLQFCGRCAHRNYITDWNAYNRNESLWVCMWLRTTEPERESFDAMAQKLYYFPWLNGNTADSKAAMQQEL